MQPKPRVPAPPQSKAELKRLRMLDAAMRCVTRQGLRATTMEEIAAEAEIARITVYREFGNRRTLIEALVAHRLAEFNKNFLETAGPFSDFNAALEAYLLTSAKNVRQVPITRELVRGKMAFVSADSPLHAVTSAMWRPWLEAARQNGQLRKNVSLNDALEWILVVQNTLARLAIDAQFSDQKLKAMIRAFIAPTFQARKSENDMKGVG